jgi:hypothetical protein
MAASRGAVTAVGEQPLMLFFPGVTLGTIPSVMARWRRPSRPGWLVVVTFWLVYLVLAAFLRNWLLILLGCLQLVLATSLAWDARWTRWTPNWWPRGRKEGRRD